MSQAARDLAVHENVLRKWVKEFAADPGHAFPGHGQMRPEQLEIDRLRREVAKLKAEPRHSKKMPSPASRRIRYDVRLHREAPRDLASGMNVRGAPKPLGGVSRSGFHARLTRTPSQRARDDEVIGDTVQSLRYWPLPHLRRPPRLADLLAEGIACVLHRVERLMQAQAQGLRARPRRRGLPKDQGEHSVIAGNVNRRPIGTPYRRAKGTPLALRGTVDAGRRFRAAGGVGRA